MEELVKTISKKFKLPEAIVKDIVQTVIGFLKERLPEPIGSQIEAFLGQGGLPKEAQGLLGGLIGKKK